MTTISFGGALRQKLRLTQGDLAQALKEINMTHVSEEEARSHILKNGVAQCDQCDWWIDVTELALAPDGEVLTGVCTSCLDRMTRRELSLKMMEVVRI